MHAIRRHLLWLGCALATAVAGRAAFEFSALMQIGPQHRFVLRDLDDQATSDWITLGQSFHGYELVDYDNQREVLTLRKGTQTLALILKGSHVAPIVATLPPELTARGITAADLVVRESGPVRINLTVGSQSQPVPRRFIDVHFDNGTDRCAVEFGDDGPRAISRSFVPEAVRIWVTDEDIAAINAHLAVVREKWLAPPKRPATSPP